MIKYYLYLDESGDFDKDLQKTNNLNPSLVGGFLWKKTDMPDAGILERKIASIYKGENHSTSLSADEKGAKVFRLLTEADSFPIDFVIFQNKEKRKILNSTTTYLTVLTEGIVQLVNTLVIRENESIELEVTAGFKKDTTIPVTSSYITGYIDLAKYKERLDEKIALAVAKSRNEQLQNSRISISLADDKRNTFLILCDYICNFWYTQSARAFNGTAEYKGETVNIRESLKNLYPKSFHYSLFSTEEQLHIQRLLQDGFYVDALFEACAGVLSEEKRTLVYESFIKLPRKQMHRQLRNLADYIGDLMLFRTSVSIVEKVIDGAEVLFHFMKENGYEDDRFYLDINLYRIAVYSNHGLYQKMEEIMLPLQKKIQKYTVQTLDIEYLMIFYTRQAVLYLNTNRFEQCCRICDEMESLLKMVDETVKIHDFFDEEEETKSESLGKVLGTKLQAQIYLLYHGLETFDVARETSERAISQFSFQLDLNRQYQYRAELEAVAGNQEDALKWLEQSFGGLSWKEQLSKPNRSIYDIYNLIFIAAHTISIASEKPLDITNYIYQKYKKDIWNDMSVGMYIRFYMGYIFMHGRFADRGRNILKELSAMEGEQNVQEINAAKAELNGQNGMNIIMGGID